MIATALTRLFELEHPIVLAPMGVVSGGRLAAAVSNAGGLGLVGGGYGDRAWLNRELDLVSQLTSRPWGVGLITWSCDRSIVDLVLAQRPHAVMLSFGDPRPHAAVIKAAGYRLICQVQDLAGARLAREAGADLIVAQGTEAGGHTGQMAGFAFVPAVREFFDGILILAGAIGDGRAIRAAEILGAELSYMGTRFIAAEESIAFQPYKQMVVESRFEDLLLSSSFTGAHAYYLKPSIINAGLDPANLPVKGKMDLTGSDTKVKAWKDVWSAGQGVGTIRSVEPVATIVDRLEQEYREACALP